MPAAYAVPPTVLQICSLSGQAVVQLQEASRREQAASTWSSMTLSGPWPSKRQLTLTAVACSYCRFWDGAETSAPGL